MGTKDFTNLNVKKDIERGYEKRELLKGILYFVYIGKVRRRDVHKDKSKWNYLHTQKSSRFLLFFCDYILEDTFLFE